MRHPGGSKGSDTGEVTEPMPEDEESLFAAALDRPSGPSRRAFLDEACAGRPMMRARLARLLAAHERTEGVLGPSAGPGAHGSGAVIADRYALVEEVGEGGMGTVWLAEQIQPVRRRVALKLIRSGMDSRAVLARFETERQALALMDHPNIAKVFDGGTTEDGRPFFVMEYVEGEPITEYCDSARLGVAERLELFMAVCGAVQHAHTKGIIHRDLKPSNVLVGPGDGRPVPKVIDFGLAKAIRGPLAESAAYVTAFGAAMGTPLYMSPEQADPANLDIDARTDIYALGVILYELLTGTTPMDRRRLRGAAWEEILRLIREEDPPRPSARLSDGDSLPSVAALRDTEPARLTRLVRGDLDWIVLKCLEKDRSRRYETPSGLAGDIRRYLEDESIEARPPSTGYRMGKFLRRNRGLAAATAAVLFVLVGGIIGTTWGMIRADRARKAEAARAEGERLANEEARRRLRQVEAGVEVLTSVFDDLDPREEREDGRTLRAILGDRLVRAAEGLEGEGVGDPLAVAGLQDRLGRSLVHLGLASKAIPFLEQARNTRATALGDDHPDTLQSMNHLAGGHKEAGRPDLAVPLLERALLLSQSRLGKDHISTLETMNDLAGCCVAVDQLDRARSLHEESLRLTRAALGPDHFNTLVCVNNLATDYLHAAMPERALPLLEDVLPRMKTTLGPRHPDTLACMTNLAAACRGVGQRERALTLIEETFGLMKARRGPTHPDTLACMNNLAAAYAGAGKPESSLTLLREAAIAIEARRFEVEDAGRIIGNLVGNLEYLRQFDEAELWRKKWLAEVKARSGADSIPHADELQDLGAYLLRRERWADAEPMLRESLAVREGKAPDTWTTSLNRSLLGVALMRLGQYAAAEPLLIRGYEGLRDHADKIPITDRSLVAQAGERVVRLYEAWGRPEQATDWRGRLTSPETASP